jgi:hypothetical protein
MMTDSTSKVHRVARRATQPVRDYINTHFEMTKDEIRRAGSSDEGVAQMVAELGNVIAETHQYQARVIGDLRDQVAELSERIAGYEVIVDHLTEVVAALTVEPESEQRSTAAPTAAT